VEMGNKKNGFTLVEIIVVVAVMLVLATLAVAEMTTANSRGCMYRHLRQWSGDIKQARADSILYNAYTYVGVSEVDENFSDTEDGIPAIAAVRDRHKSVWVPGDKYYASIGTTTNHTTGETIPTLAECGKLGNTGLLLLEQAELPSLPPGLLNNLAGVGLPEFPNNTFAISPSGNIVNAAGQSTSGAFYFGFNYEANNFLYYGAIYVTSTGDIRIYFLGSGAADDWVLVE